MRRSCIICSISLLSLISCGNKNATGNYSSIGGTLNFSLSDLNFKTCESINIKNILLSNPSVGLISALILNSKSNVLLGVFDFREAQAAINIKEVGEYGIAYNFINPEFPINFKLDFTCKSSGKTISKKLTLNGDRTTMNQNFSVDFN